MAKKKIAKPKVAVTKQKEPKIVEPKKRKNSPKITGGSKYILTPDQARVFVTIDKDRLKSLKKCAIDLEIEFEDVVLKAIDDLVEKYNSEIEKEGKDTSFESSD
jgi:hypothetical protein